MRRTSGPDVCGGANRLLIQRGVCALLDLSVSGSLDTNTAAGGHSETPQLLKIQTAGGSTHVVWHLAQLRHTQQIYYDRL